MRVWKFLDAIHTSYGLESKIAREDGGLEKNLEHFVPLSLFSHCSIKQCEILHYSPKEALFGQFHIATRRLCEICLECLERKLCESKS